MKTIHFPYLGLALGLFLLMVITRGSETDAEGYTALPLLTLLIINECAFILTSAGVFIGLKQLFTAGFEYPKDLFYAMTIAVCTLLSIQFTLLAIQLWPL